MGLHGSLYCTYWVFWENLDTLSQRILAEIFEIHVVCQNGWIREVKNNSIVKVKRITKFLQLEWNLKVMFLLLNGQFASL